MIKSLLFLMNKVEVYSRAIELEMQNFHQSLSEKAKRHYGAVEANKIGYGGASYISRVLSCDPRTIRRGQKELAYPLSNNSDRIRNAGGGRKSSLITIEGIDEAFLTVIEGSTAGSPMDETIKWTNLSRKAIVLGLEGQGIFVSVTVVKNLLKKHNFRSRKAFKSEAGKADIAHRNEQFEKIEELKKEYHEADNPVMSMDVKKRVDRQSLS